MRSVLYVEVDVPFCTLTYSVAPCEAALGVTGEKKCFNTRETCQDVENFSPAPLTLRFAEASADLDPTIDAIPSLEGVSITPALVEPGVSLGQRESVVARFSDHPHSDAGLDKYLVDRAYNPFDQGTFWGKFRARHRSLKGQALRVIYGEPGQALADMTTRNYIIEDLTGPSGDTFSIIAKDALKLADGDRAQAPAISNGELAGDLETGTGSLTLSPTGIGDLEYPAAGKVAIGGKEIVSFTRSGDVMTITRAQSNTDATEHDAGELVQLVLEYVSESPADIIYDLLTTYAPGFDAAWIPLASWQQELETWIGRLYSAEIAEPTPVRQLVSELIEQVGLVLWQDVIEQQTNLTALRPVSQTASIYDLDRIWADSFSATEQPKKRVSQVWTYFGLLNPLSRLDDPQNFTSAVATIDPEGTEDFYDEQPAIKKIFSRWIDSGNRPAASRLNELILARYSKPPRRFSWSIGRADETPELGRGARIREYHLQDDQGAAVTAPTQVTSVRPRYDRFDVSGEEMLFTGDITGDKIVIIDTDGFDINLRDLYDQFYAEPQVYDEVVFVIELGVKVGGKLGGMNTDDSLPASVRGRSITVGDWPAGVSVTLTVIGGAHGKGGDGGDEEGARADGGVGGTAIYTRAPIAIDNQGTIRGGGGGGGGASEGAGGGGAGYVPGTSGSGGALGTVDAGGVGGEGAGAGGDPGQPGEDGAIGSGGAAGYAIDGISFVTWITEGDVVGPQVN